MIIQRRRWTTHKENKEGGITGLASRVEVNKAECGVKEYEIVNGISSFSGVCRLVTMRK